ncbi:phospholipase D family protein [Fictibacillus sp. WQ 8-8]|uniref:phospholipase D family protein n=1 Tax=Fictibacillus sp. WQ 8-8 TaxID=2938788 RepID=UPI002109A218|nr:phospholipase D family protein [Fictibacillus sp. WQ 8-8]MCQ6264707.1 phospholipase D family protein [Fictibacillus sp. WQ 8-8]
MAVTLITEDLFDQFNELLDTTEKEINIISPFIGRKTSLQLAKWLTINKGINCNLITRFYREEFIENVSSLSGIEVLMNAGVNIYALVDLHTKLYVFDNHSAIIGSANFTQGGFVSNHELCILLNNEREIAERSNKYFYDLLGRIIDIGEGKVTQEWIETEIEMARKTAPFRKAKNTTYTNVFKRGAVLPKLKKVDLFEEILENTPTNNIDSNSSAWFKFEGTGEDRIPNYMNYREMKGVRKRDLNQTFFPRRPSGIEKGDILFLTIVSMDDKDVPTPMIVGYAETEGYIAQNIANANEIKETPWKDRFPYFVEFTRGKAINAPIKRGIRLIDLYNSLGKDTYPSLQQKSDISLKNLHTMHFRRSHIRITHDAKNHLKSELDKLFVKYGSIDLG